MARRLAPDRTDDARSGEVVAQGTGCRYVMGARLIVISTDRAGGRGIAPALACCIARRSQPEPGCGRQKKHSRKQTVRCSLD
jgi:hypothetical protein